MASCEAPLSRDAVSASVCAASSRTRAPESGSATVGEAPHPRAHNNAKLAMLRDVHLMQRPLILPRSALPISRSEWREREHLITKTAHA